MFSSSHLGPGFALGNREDRLPVFLPHPGSWKPGKRKLTREGCGSCCQSTLSTAFQQGQEEELWLQSLGWEQIARGCVACFLALSRPPPYHPVPKAPASHRAVGPPPLLFPPPQPASSFSLPQFSSPFNSMFSSLLNDTGEYLLSPMYMPSTLLSTLHGLSSLILKIIPKSVPSLRGSEAGHQKS